MRVSRRTIDFVLMALFVCSLPAVADEINAIDGATYFGLAPVNADGELVKKGGIHYVPVQLTLGYLEETGEVYGMLTKAEYLYDDPESPDRELLGFTFACYGLHNGTAKSDTKFTFKLQDVDGKVSKKMKAVIKDDGDLLLVKLPGAGGKKVRVPLCRSTNPYTGVYYEVTAKSVSMADGDPIAQAVHEFFVIMFGMRDLYAVEDGDWIYHPMGAGMSGAHSSSLEWQGGNTYYSENGTGTGFYSFSSNGTASIDFTTYDPHGNPQTEYSGTTYRNGQTTSQLSNPPAVDLVSEDRVSANESKVDFRITGVAGLGYGIRLRPLTTTGQKVANFSYMMDMESGVLYVEAVVSSTQGLSGQSFAFQLTNDKGLVVGTAVLKLN